MGRQFEGCNVERNLRTSEEGLCLRGPKQLRAHPYFPSVSASPRCNHCLYSRDFHNGQCNATPTGASEDYNANSNWSVRKGLCSKTREVGNSFSREQTIRNDSSHSISCCVNLKCLYPLVSDDVGACGSYFAIRVCGAAIVLKG
jgi:hypothetical protein